MATSLPFDIISKEILPKLPPISLLRFKSVSKLFQTLISDPNFTLHHSNSNPNRFIFFKARCGGFYTFDLDSPRSSATRFPIPIPQTDTDADLDTETDTALSTFIGSCNGLICLKIKTTNSYNLLVFNPCTRTHRFMGPNPLALDYSPNHGFGFGYDPIRHDYKIVHVCNMDEVWVYSFNLSTWKLAVPGTGADYMYNFTILHTVVVNNQFVHWKCVGPGPGQTRIRCFDICAESWAPDVALPDEKQCERDLGVVNGLLCLLSRDFDWGSGANTVVWVMREYGVKDSWERLLSLSEDSRLMLDFCPLTCGSNVCGDEALFARYRESTLFWCNVRDHTCRQAEIRGVPLYSEAHVFKPSLVAVPGGEPIIEAPRKRKRSPPLPSFALFKGCSTEAMK